MVDYMLALTIMQQSEFGRRERRRHDWTLDETGRQRWTPRLAYWRFGRRQPVRR